MNPLESHLESPIEAMSAVHAAIGLGKTSSFFYDTFSFLKGSGSHVKAKEFTSTYDGHVYISCYFDNSNEDYVELGLKVNDADLPSENGFFRYHTYRVDARIKKGDVIAIYTRYDGTGNPRDGGIAIQHD